MKIVGQSTLANGTPYVHLGYLAAGTHTSTKQNSAWLGGAAVTLVLGVAMGLAVMISDKKAPGSGAFKFVQRNFNKLVFGAVALITLACICFVLAMSN